MSNDEGDAPLAPTRHASGATAAVVTLRQKVESGDVTLDPAAGEEILSMLAEQRDQVDAWLARADDLARHAPLGKNVVGEAMAGKFVNRASGESDSFSGVLRHYRRVLEDAHDAVSDSMKQYRDVEEGAADMFRTLDRSFLS